MEPSQSQLHVSEVAQDPRAIAICNARQLSSPTESWLAMCGVLRKEANLRLKMRGAQGREANADTTLNLWARSALSRVARRRSVAGGNSRLDGVLPI